jgi:hypothetical protein
VLGGGVGVQKSFRAIETVLARLIGIGRNDVPVADLGNWMYQIRVSGWTSKFCSIFREAENVLIRRTHRASAPAVSPAAATTRRRRKGAIRRARL